jgi:hypothetical protein
MPESVLLVEIPEAEPVVGSHRQRLDAVARLGVPAHVTVLFPFMGAEWIDDAVLESLRAVFAPVSGFGYRFEQLDWFGDEVLWLAPRDPAPFRRLTERAYAAFPDFPPFGGRHEDIRPHLTVGNREGDRGLPLEELRAAAEALPAGLPVQGEARAVTLMVESGGHWIRRAVLPLTGA